MRKRLLLLTLLLAMFAPWAAQAQEELTIYQNATGTNAYVPVYGTWADAYLKCEFVVPADQLEDMANGTISQMTFYLSSPASAAWTGTFQVFLKEVDETTLSAWSGTDNATIVYEGTLDATGSTMTVEFSENYAYEDGNLLVGVYQTAKGNYKGCSFTGESVTGASGSNYNSSSLSGITFSQRNFIPKTTFTYTPGSGVTCEKPESLEETALTSTSYTFDIVGGSGVYNIDYKKASETEWTNRATDFEGNNVVLNGLTSGTNYTVRVQSVCDDATSGWKSKDFTTSCEAITTFPWSETFESYAASSSGVKFEDPCWENIHLEGAGSYFFEVYSGTQGTNSTKMLRLRDMTSGTMTKLRLPEMTLPTGDNYQFVIDVYRNSGTANYGEGIRVYASSDGEIEGATEVAFISRSYTTSDGNLIPAESASGWYTYELPIPMTGTCYIVLRGESKYGSSTYMDNFKVQVAPTCLKPTGLTVTANSVTAHTADITWESDASQWIVEYAKNSNFESPISENVSGQAALHIQGLDAETTYYVHVKADCGDSQSDWSSTVSFTTPVACPAPTALTCTNVTANTAELSWTDNANTTSWDVQYNTTNDFNDSYISASANGTPTITLDNLTPETTYYARVMAYCEGEGVSTFSNVVSFEPTAKLVIGSGNSTSSYLPSNTNYDYSFTQQIYTVEELGEAGVIESIDFYMTSTSAYTRNLDIYMVSTQKNSFENNSDWIAVTDADLVYSGDVAFAAQAWTTITLDNGFIYDGTQNVAIIVDDNTGEYSSRYFKSFTASANQALYKYQDNNDLPITYTGSGSTTTSKNQIRILKSEVPDCVKPTALTATEVGPDFATIDWSQYGDVTSWNVEVTGDYATTWTANTHPFTIPGLSSSTEYSVRVSPACDETLWSDAITFTTLEACPTPENVEVSDITHTTANVAWTGYSDSYTMFYRETPGLGEPIFSEGFEGGVMPEGWISEGDASWTIGTGDNGNYPSITAHNGDYNAKQSSSSTGSNNQGYLVTPAMDLSGQEGLVLNFWYINRNWSSDIDGLGIYYRVDEGDWNELWSTAEAHTTWTNQTIDLPSLAANYQIGFMYTDSYGYGVGLDDIEIAPKLTADWTTINSATSPQAISGLTAGTDYEVKVQGFCGDTPSEESEVITFSTLSENYKLFVTEGDWKVANNWEPAGAPTIEQDVELRANVTITEPAQANNITQGNYTITIEDGGQLVHNNTGITATVKKNITGYGAENVGAFNNYYFISDPLTSSITPSEANGLLSGNYDLYDWNATVTDGDEWRNYKTDPFTLLYGLYGYLYANEAGTELSFTGTIRASVNAQSRYVSANTSTSYDFGSWALLGNPFVCDAYLVNAYTNGTALPFYRLTSEGNYEALTGVAIAPMEGIFYEAASSTSVYMSRTAPATQNNGKLNMNLRSNNKQLDNAILVFGDNQRLGKMSFRENSSKIYMPVEGKDYAIATAESNVGEMPVNFKAENNGSYTLSFNAEEVNFAYLHLIDNMTGIETDLLSNPSYSFEARTTDYANRFKLVFATGNADDTFAFFSNGSFVINNEGNATLQVIDVTGRILNSETINGCANVNVNAAPGVYMLRLVNGDNVKVQKVVVR